MARRRRFDRFTLDTKQAHRRESDGALLVPARFARTGTQVYQNPDGSDRVEYRSPTEVIASAPTFEGKTLTDQHPIDFVDPDNWQELARGHLESVQVVDSSGEAEIWLEATLVINAGSLADAVERGERSELSGGYYCDYLEGSGEHRGTAYHGAQTEIVGNHVAALAPGEARAGRGARMRLDSTGHEIPPVTGGQEDRRMTRIDSRGVAFDVEGAAGEGLKSSLEEERKEAEGSLEAVQAELEESQKALSEALAERDAALTRVAELEAELVDAQDPKTRAEDAAQLQQIIEQATVVAGKIVDVQGTPHEIRLTALKIGGEDILAVIPKDRKTDTAYLDAYTAARFDAAYAVRRNARASVTGNHSDGAENAPTNPIAAALVRKNDRRDADSRRVRGLPAGRTN